LLKVTHTRIDSVQTGFNLRINAMGFDLVIVEVKRPGRVLLSLRELVKPEMGFRHENQCLNIGSIKLQRLLPKVDRALKFIPSQFNHRKYAIDIISSRLDRYRAFQSLNRFKVNESLRIEDSKLHVSGEQLRIRADRPIHPH